MLINEIGIDEFKKMVLKGKLEKEGKRRDQAEYVASLIKRNEHTERLPVASLVQAAGEDTHLFVRLQAWRLGADFDFCRPWSSPSIQNSRKLAAHPLTKG